MDLYREEILEHWQNPVNFGVMKDADVVVEQVNPVCGDEITLYVRFSAELRVRKNAELRRRPRNTPGVKSRRYLENTPGVSIADVRFTSSGCAISMASASILSEAIKNKSIAEISKLEGQDVLDLIGADLSFPPARLKCAFLALEAVKKIRIMN